MCVYAIETLSQTDICCFLKIQLKSNELSTGVSSLDGVPLSVKDSAKINTWQQFKPSYRPADAIWSLLTTLTVDSFGTRVQLLTGGGSNATWVWSPTQLLWERLVDGPILTQSGM